MAEGLSFGKIQRIRQRGDDVDHSNLRYRLSLWSDWTHQASVARDNAYADSVAAVGSARITQLRPDLLAR